MLDLKRLQIKTMYVA